MFLTLERLFKELCKQKLVGLKKFVVAISLQSVAHITKHSLPTTKKLVKVISLKCIMTVSLMVRWTSRNIMSNILPELQRANWHPICYEDGQERSVSTCAVGFQQEENITNEVGVQ